MPTNLLSWNDIPFAIFDSHQTFEQLKEKQAIVTSVYCKFKAIKAASNANKPQKQNNCPRADMSRPFLLCLKKALFPNSMDQLVSGFIHSMYKWCLSVFIKNISLVILTQKIEVLTA